MKFEGWDGILTGPVSWRRREFAVGPLWIVPPLPPDGKWVTTATFDAPGTYVLRARADDGALLGDEEVTVTVAR
jgi:hypothetical protein